MAEDFHNLSVRTAGDLFLYFPRTYEDRSKPIPLRTALGKNGPEPINTVVEVIAHDFFGWGRKQTLKIYVQDETATAALVCFGRNFLQNSILPGQRYFLYGKFEYKYGELQSSSFDMEPYSEKPSGFGSILPIYPLSGRLNQGFLRRIMYSLLDAEGKYLEPELPEQVQARKNLLPTPEAYRNIHFPGSVELLRLAKKTLIFEELFYLQLVIGKNRLNRSTVKREERHFPGTLRQQLIENLPFTLTSGQFEVLREIDTDISSSAPMARLLQGDVGCGKTLVAFLTALSFIETGMQAVLMAPTELLAKQHAENAFTLLSSLGVQVAFLSGSVTGEKRRTLLDRISSGEVDLIAGTHALFSEDVRFHKLGFIIIDEQHRFGVLQRRPRTFSL